MKRVLLSTCLGIFGFVSTSLCHVYASKSDSSKSEHVQRRYAEVKVGDVVWIQNIKNPLVISHVYPDANKVDLKLKKNGKDDSVYKKGVPFNDLYFEKLVNSVYDGGPEKKKIISFRYKNKYITAHGSSSVKRIAYGLVKAISYDQSSVLFITGRYNGTILSYGAQRNKVYAHYFKNKEQFHNVRNIKKVRHLESIKYKKMTKTQRFFHG